MAGEEQEQRRESDPWEDVFRSVKGVVYPNEEDSLEERVHTQELLLKLGIPTDKQKLGKPCGFSDGPAPR